MALIETTDTNFTADVLEAKDLCLVDFWAEWCGPCQMVGPILSEVATDRPSGFKVVKVNIDQNPEMPSKYGVRSIPTLMLFKNGEMVDSKVGVLPKTTILEWVDSHL